MSKSQADEIIALLSTTVLVLLWMGEAHWSLIIAVSVKAATDWVFAVMTLRLAVKQLKKEVEDLQNRHE